MKFLLLRCCLSLYLLGWVQACLWDSDTLAAEAQGREGEVRTLVGWFDRNPPRYYEMRLSRVEKELAEAPESFNLYDDAAVACDRLGRSDEAIEWIERKREAIESSGVPVSDEVRYRSAANLGTFYAHRWVMQPRDERNADLSDLEKACEQISLALKINPEAHFGREEVQLLFLQWLLNQEAPSISHHAILSPEGLIGLVRLGAAWESQDVFRAIQSSAGRQRDGNLAEIAKLRLAELEVEQGGVSSLHPTFEKDGENARLLGVAGGWILRPSAERIVGEWYQEARQAADARHASRLAFMQSRFDEGKHPDTDQDFWNGWSEPEFPPMPDDYMADPQRGFRLIAYGVLGVAVLILIGGFALNRFLRRPQKRFKLGK